MDIQADSNDFGQRFVSAIDQFQYDQAKQIARDAVKHFKALLSDDKNDDATLNAALFSAVLFRGLFDYAHLAERTSDPKWVDNRNTIQDVWGNLCDCRDRITFVAGVSSGQMFTRIFTTLDKVESWYARRFGSGVYSSPEILVKRELCSICKRDIRRCEHIAGDVYRGRICYRIPKDISLKNSSMVLVPHDRRCRIWPWQLKGGVVSDILLMSTFRVDDFLDNDEWQRTA